MNNLNQKILNEDFKNDANNYIIRLSEEEKKLYEKFRKKNILDFQV